MFTLKTSASFIAITSSINLSSYWKTMISLQSLINSLFAYDDKNIYKKNHAN
jgi:hypothetical protein